MNFIKTSVGAACLAAVAALGVPTAASAAATYCSVVGSPNTDGMKLGDLTFNTVAAGDCYGILSGNDVAPGSGDKADNINALNLNWGTNWQYLVKDDVAGSATTGSFGGYSFDLSSGAAGTSGNWTLSVSPTTGLPIYVDFIASLKGSNEFALWYFDDVAVGGNNSGTWQSVFTNQNGNLQNLSHLTLFVRAGEAPPPPPPPPEEIPEPGALALAAAGLLAAALVRRRRKS